MSPERVLADLVDAEVSHDGVDPGREAGVRLEVGGALRDAHERLLDDVLGRGSLTQVAEGEVVEPGLVPSHEHRESRPIAALEADDEHFVGQGRGGSRSSRDPYYLATGRSAVSTLSSASRARTRRAASLGLHGAETDDFRESSRRGGRQGRPRACAARPKRAMTRACARLSTVLVCLSRSSIAAACGGAAAPPAEAPKPAATAPDGAGAKKASAQDDKAAKAAAIDALVADESKKGACDEGHKAALEKLLADVEAGMKAKNGEDGKPLGLQLVAKRVVPLGCGGEVDGARGDGTRDRGARARVRRARRVARRPRGHGRGDDAALAVPAQRHDGPARASSCRRSAPSTSSRATAVRSRSSRASRSS